jgi:hypothetical protein
MARDDAASDTHVYAPGNKHQVLENAPKTIKELRFGVL